MRSGGTCQEWGPGTASTHSKAKGRCRKASLLQAYCVVCCWMLNRQMQQPDAGSTSTQPTLAHPLAPLKLTNIETTCTSPHTIEKTPTHTPHLFGLFIISSCTMAAIAASPPAPPPYPAARSRLAIGSEGAEGLCTMPLLLPLPDDGPWLLLLLPLPGSCSPPPSPLLSLADEAAAAAAAAAAVAAAASCSCCCCAAARALRRNVASGP